MSRYLSGRLVAVDQRRLGRRLAADHAAGVSTLTVISTVVFDEDGGSLQVNGQVIGYTGLNEETGELFLSGSLEEPADEGDRVLVFDELYQRPAVTMTAQVDLDEDDDADEPVEATVAHHLQKEVPPGLRGGTIPAESVLLDYDEDDDEWRIIDILGLDGRNGTGTAFWQDQHTATVIGEQSFNLTHEPIDQSEHFYWNGLYQPASVWSRSGRAVTVPDTAGDLQAGDELVVEYAYRVGAALPWQTLVNWEATGWRGLSISKSDSTDRSAPSFNDSGWSTYRTPVSDTLDPHPSWPGIPTPNSTGLADGAGIWLRRVVSAEAIREVRISARADNHADVYWNGTLLGTLSDVEDVGGFLEVPNALIAAENTLAIRATDDNLAGASVNRSYIDVRVEGR